MKYYCIGIKGTGMSTLAQILFDLGNDVSGYDDAKEHKYTQDGLDDRGITIYYDHEHEIDKDTIVTYSVAFSEDHPELQRVKKMGLTIKKYGEIMGDVISMFKSIGVSGTHGKTSTSSMIKHILTNSIGCNYFIGAGDGYAAKENDYFVVESDEFNRHFTYYHPKYSIITNIEAEHLECYKDIDDIRNTFEIFANNTSKLIIANGDNQEVRKINYNTKVLFYGFGFNNDIVIKNVKLEETGSTFDIYINEELYGSFEIPLYGKIGKTTIVDDYAHHPTEIKATLEGIRQKFPDKRIVVVFAPNTYSRTRDFKEQFIDSLNVADKAFVTEIDSNREKSEDYPGVSSQIIIDGLNDGDIISEETIDKLTPELDSIICFMGCAYVGGLIDSLKKLIISLDNEKED